MADHETPLTRAMWEVHHQLSETNKDVDPEVAESIARAAITEYLYTLGVQNTIRIGYINDAEQALGDHRSGKSR